MTVGKDSEQLRWRTGKVFVRKERKESEER